MNRRSFIKTTILLLTISTLFSLFGLSIVPDAAAQSTIDFTERSMAQMFANVSNNLDWRSRYSDNPPPGGKALAYDEAHGVTVLFSSGNGTNETWEWDGLIWNQRFSANQPTYRQDTAMAYDSKREVVVLFGGWDIALNRLNDTWEWDGTNWTQRIPADKPPERTYHAMAYDSIRGVTILFGGMDDSWGELGDTWEWDGTNWAKCAPVNKPTPSSSPEMAYDSTRGVTVLFSSENGNGETWEWDGVNWAKRSPTNKPKTRTGHSMAYDSTRGMAVLFGGWDGNMRLDETWEWNGVNWTQRFPENKPAARSGHFIAYDSAREVTVLFGGRNNSDTWEWNGMAWTYRSGIAGNPGGRSGHAMAYDSVRGGTVLFGGQHNKLGTWEYTGVNWTRLSPVNEPPQREDTAMVFDSKREVTVLFGGYSNTYLNDTWEWDGTNWLQLSPATAPPSRMSHAMVYDSKREVTLLFGGLGYGDQNQVWLNDMWEWDGVDWVQVGSANRPTIRHGHAMAYDSEREMTILFGGITIEDENLVILDDTWEWDGESWAQRTPVNSPPARDYHAMVYDSTRGVTLLFGGFSNPDGYTNLYRNDTWGWNGTDWTEQFPVNKPAARSNHAMAYDSELGVTVLFGGNIPESTYLGDDTWEFGVGVEPVQADFSAEPSSGAAPLQVWFKNQSIGDYETCAWDFGDGASSGECEDPTHSYTSKGVFSVSLSVSGRGGGDVKTRNEFISVKKGAGYTICLPLIIK